MNCCDYDCRQGDDCPARKAATPPPKPVEHTGSAPGEPAQDFDPIPRIGGGLRVVRWIGLSLMFIVTVVWVAGLAGFLYARHQGV